tara:strand:+ start:615 stop:974 length:360 start_codon:yes stop_codon:yes gene_type:complete
MALYGASPVSTQRHPITHWVTFRGESSVLVRASGNVSSITDRGTGYYSVNFSTNMPDINYCIFGNTIKGDQNDDGNAGLQAGGCDTSIQIYTSNCRVRTKVMSNNDSQDTQYAHVAFTH